MSTFSRTVETLCAASRAAASPPAWSLEWPETLPAEVWLFSPEWISLYGSDVYRSLDESQRRRLSLHEAVGFFSLNVHGERLLLEGLARRLHTPATAGYSAYLHHFLEEENRHLAYFAEFCSRYAAGVHPGRRVAFPREYAPGEEEVLFFARALVFEEIVDAYNRAMAADPRLHPLVREIHRLHHRDESRHLAFGRRLVPRLVADHAPRWTPEVRQRVRDDLWLFIEATWREYASADAYRDTGLPEPYVLREQALALPAFAERRRRLTAPCASFLVRHGVLDSRPIR